MKIQWTNKYSKEQGYVKKLNKKGRYFENTPNLEEAHNFAQKTINDTLTLLVEFCDDNTYAVVE
jgi:hypothetical protein